MVSQSVRPSSLFYNKKYMLLLSAQTISNVGDWLHILALFALVALKWNGTPFMMTGIILCLAVPTILFGSFAGIIADRYNRKWVMILADICRAASVVGLAFSHSIWQVYLFLIVISFFSSLFSPAKSGKLKEIVTKEQLQPAVAYSQTVNNAAKIIGPILSGIFVASLGIQWSFYLDSISFILSAILLCFLQSTKIRVETPIDLNEKPTSPIEKKSWLADFSDGMKILKTLPLVFIGLFILCVVFMALQISDSQCMILFREVKGSAIHLVGYAMAASGAGMLISSLILSKKRIRSHLLVLAITPLIIGVVIIGAAVTIHLPIALLSFLDPILFFFGGFSFSMAVIPFEVLVQEHTPEQFTGRIFGVVNSASTLSVISGLIIGGTFTQFLGVITTFIISGSLLILISLYVLLYRKSLESRGQHSGTESIKGTL